MGCDVLVTSEAGVKLFSSCKQLYLNMYLYVQKLL